MNGTAKPQVKVKELLPKGKGLCLLIQGLFSQKHCESLLDFASNIGFSSASEKYPKSYRNNERIQVDDLKLSEKLFSMCLDYLPQKRLVNSVEASITSLNSRLRFCKYSSGQQFTIHRDGVYHQSKDKQSTLTFLLYLNGSVDFEGGTTSFFADQFGQELLAKYKPKVGDVLVFDHDIWHSGDPVSKNSKYVLRSDFIYQAKVDAPIKEPLHKGYIWKILGMPDGSIASASRDKTIKIWDSNLCVEQELVIHKNSVLDMCTTKSQDIFAVSRDGYISCWKYRDRQYELEFYKDTGHPCAISITRLKNGRLVSTGSDNKVRLWSSKGEEVATSGAFSDWLWKVEQLNECKLVSCSADGVVYLLDSETLNLLAESDIGLGPIRTLTTAEEYIYIGTETGYLVELCKCTLKVLRKWRAHKGVVRDILNFNGMIYTCSEDNSVKCFKSKKLVRSYSHEQFATSLTVVNRTVYSASYDGSIEAFQ